MKLIFRFLLFILALETTAQDRIEFKKRLEGPDLVLSIKKETPVPILVTIKSDSLDLDESHLISVSSKFQDILRITANGLTERDTLSKFINFSTSIGDPNATHDSKYRYQLPFAKGKSYNLIQGFGGKFSHSTASSRYALDFKMAIGQPVHAARDGIVCWVNKEFNEGGKDRAKYINSANRIMILHADGSVAYYLHLKKDGALVEIGDEVKQGQLIGLSGNTGFSTGPHLHFVIRVGAEAVKFRFIDQRPQLKKGRFYSY